MSLEGSTLHSPCDTSTHRLDGTVALSEKVISHLDVSDRWAGMEVRRFEGQDQLLTYPKFGAV
jgi:hypothetical protein